jgi:hypothetical protein
VAGRTAVLSPDDSGRQEVPAPASRGQIGPKEIQSEGEVSRIRWTRGVKHQVDFHLSKRPECQRFSLLSQAASASVGGYAAASAGEIS